MMGLAGLLSVQVLTPLAVFFAILAFTVVGMATKLLRHLAQLQQPEAVVRRSGEVA
jgi:DHA1 family 2-module integral membrane pump EmrD-like MFS transporter